MRLFNLASFFAFSVIILLASCTTSELNLKPDSSIEEPIQPSSDAKTTIEETEVPGTKNIVVLGSTVFQPEQLIIKTGDTVIWKNKRTGSYAKALIHGTRQCVSIKSPILESGGEFSWTFDTPGTCIIIDAITQTVTSKVIVEE